MGEEEGVCVGTSLRSERVIQFAVRYEEERDVEKERIEAEEDDGNEEDDGRRELEGRSVEVNQERKRSARAHASLGQRLSTHRLLRSLHSRSVAKGGERDERGRPRQSSSTR